MRIRTIVLGASLCLVTVAAFVACTGDSVTTTSTADAGHDGGPSNTTDGSASHVDGSSPVDSGSEPLDAGVVVDASIPDPTTFGSRLVLWLSADNGYDTDGGFAQWKDRSGTGNDAVQPTPGKIPALFDGGAGVNGQPVLHFTGAEFLQIADNASLQWAASDFTLFMVERHINPTNQYAILYTKWTDDGAQGYPGFFLWANYPTTNGLVTRLDTQNIVFGPDAGNDNVARVVGARRNGTDLQLYSGGTLLGEMPDSSIANPAEFNADTIPAYIGGRPQAVQMLQGDVAEVIGVKGTLTDKELATLQSYLKAKYKL